MEVVSLAAKIRAGMMVILLIALSLYVIDLLSPEEKGQVYVMYFEDSVSGLEKNASVLYNGIQIGFVLSIEPFPTNFVMLNRVKVRITSDNPALRIYKDAETINYLTVDSVGTTGKEIGIKEGYSILAVNGKSIRSEREFRSTIAAVFNTAYRSKKEEIYKLTLKNLSTQDEYTYEGSTKDGKLLVTFKEPDVLEKGTRAALNQNFVTGLKWVELSGGNNTLLELVGSSNEQETTDQHEILSERGFLSKLASEQNLQRITKFIDNTETIISNVSDITSHIRVKLPKITDRIDEIISKEGEIVQFLNNLNETLDSVEKLWQEEGQLFEGLKEVREVVANLRKQTEEGGNLELLLKNINNFVLDLNDVLKNQDLWLVQTAESAKKLMNSLDQELQEGGKLYSSLKEMNGILTDLRQSLKSGDIHKRIKEIGQLIRNLDQVFSQDFRGAMLSFNKAMNEFYEGLASMTANPGNFIIGVKNRK